MNMNIPAGYQSTDVIDRRNGEKPTITDKARDLSLKVRHDYEDSFHKNNYYSDNDMKPSSQAKSTRKYSSGKR